MGAQQSTSGSDDKKSLSSTIDYLAANYILTSKFQDFKKLTDPQYCKNLVVLTSDVISRYLSHNEIEYLKQRMEGNQEVLAMSNPEKIAYFNKNNLGKMDVKSELKKKRMCIAIAKYYVQIFHIFNAIAHTINPVYTWKDQFGSTVSVDYENRTSIPANVKPTISKVNLCSSRINALLGDKSILNTVPNTVVNVNATFCELNRTKDGTSKSLVSEPGIPELEKLYYDEYDYNTGVFSSMSKDMSSQYKKDLLMFYTLFTGEKNMPNEITKFGQIPLRNYQKINQCKTNGAFTKSYTGTLKEKLFGEYANNIKTMMKKTEDNQKILLSIIDQLFVFAKDPQNPVGKIIIVNPKLDNKLLSKLIKDTRANIINMYTTCEQDFFKGLQLFEALVEKQIIDTSASQIKKLQENIEETISLEPSETPDSVKIALENNPTEKKVLLNEPEPQHPSTDPPSTDPPSTDPPSTDPPSTDPPSTDPPSTDP
jgi:hypothetical protein